MVSHLQASSEHRWALFGATGITGRLLLQRAVDSGHRPVLIGRDIERVQAVAAPYGLAAHVAPLHDPHALAAALSGVRLVVNAAGPYAKTAMPMHQAAIRAGVDSIDLNGELSVAANILGLQREAKNRGVALITGAGFGVAATDGLSLLVAERLGGVDWLRIGVSADSGHKSDGAAESTLAVLAAGGYEICAGQLTRRRLARVRWMETTSPGATTAFASAPLADLIAAHHVTAAREIVAGVPMPTVRALMLRTIAPALPFMLCVGPIRRQLANAGGHTGARPGKAHQSQAWVLGGNAENHLLARLDCGEGYAAAVDIAVTCVESVLAARPSPGAHTPASAFGSSWIFRVPGIEIQTDPIRVTRSPSKPFGPAAARAGLSR